MMVIGAVNMYYQNPALADQAEQFAKSLRDHNPGIGVN